MGLDHPCTGAECPTCGIFSPWLASAQPGEWVRCHFCQNQARETCRRCRKQLCDIHSYVFAAFIAQPWMLCEACHRDIMTYDPAYKHNPIDTHKAQLSTFRDSCGNAVTEPIKYLRVGTTVIIPHGAHFAEGAPWNIVIHQRADNHRWGLPGGAMEIGESVGMCAIRECYEETGLKVYLMGVSSIDSDPTHHAICQYPDGNIVQYCNVTFLGRIISGVLRKSEESMAVAWCSTDNLPISFLPLHRWRIKKAIENIKDLKYNIAY